MSIIKKPNGKYIVDIVNEHGKRVQRTFNKKSEADAYEASIKRNKYDTKLVHNKLIKARHLLEESIEEYRRSKQNLKPNSIKKYKTVIDFFKDFVNVNHLKYVDEFGPSKAEKFYQHLVAERELDKGNHKQIIKAKPKTINFYLATVRELFKREILKDHIQKNPFAHIKNLRVERPHPEYYTKEEIQLFFSQPMKVEYHNAFKAFLLTGTRFEELANLKVTDIDLNERTVNVCNKEGFTTKTENAVRVIPMSDELYDILLSIVNNAQQNDYVFKSPNGSKLRERSLLTVCKRVAKNAGITSRAFIHKFRHTFATMLVQSDVPLESIKELLGHSSVVETEIYAHNKTNHRHHQVRILDDLFK
ncbi:MAG: tyrosine-type recombinase/integrase [Ignavibacteriota bacterium]